MLYLLLFARIHWQAPMTSLVSALPLSSMTRIDTIGAFGAAPAYPVAEPAAIPATKVPWPRPSPIALGVSELRFTWVRTRVPKSARIESTPESTTAIAGPTVPVERDELQSEALPDS